MSNPAATVRDVQLALKLLRGYLVSRGPSPANVEKALRTLRSYVNSPAAPTRGDVKLHNVARSVIRMAKWQHRCTDGVGGCIAVSQSQMIKLFHTARVALGEGTEQGGRAESEAELNKQLQKAELRDPGCVLP